jgi:hypothetical protein
MKPAIYAWRSRAAFGVRKRSQLLGGRLARSNLQVELTDQLLERDLCEQPRDLIQLIRFRYRERHWILPMCTPTELESPESVTHNTAQALPNKDPLR